jgi:uncharacterized protein DUF1841
MFAPSREQARRFFFDTWSKYRQGMPLSALEKTALGVVLQHPEYHPLLESAEQYLDRDYTPEDGELNPFLHLSLHLAIEEQLSIDQPRGIRDGYDRLVKKTGSEHDAKHEILECLGETLWEAQRAGRPPNENLYLQCVEKRAEGMKR